MASDSGKDATTLKGLNIVVTRPMHQAEGLCAMIEAEGGHVKRLPLIEIAPPREIKPALNIVARLHEFDIAVFISANAVEKTLELSATRNIFPGRLRLAAVGASTAKALQQHGYHVDIKSPPPFNSESLLSTAELHDVSSKHIVIFRGEGGRETLADTLRQRGATVEYAEVYRRRRPDINLDQQISASAREKTDIIVISSNEALHNLVDLAMAAGLTDWLLAIPLAVISKRTADEARKLGFKHVPVIAREASDMALVEALKSWHSSRAAADFRRGGT